MGKLRYKVNYIPVAYNFKTRLYENGIGSFDNYREAIAARWKCEKCETLFGALLKLKLHKAKAHSY